MASSGNSSAEALVAVIESHGSLDEDRKAAAIRLCQAIGRTDAPDLAMSLALMCAVKAR